MGKDFNFFVMHMVHNYSIDIFISFTFFKDRPKKRRFEKKTSSQFRERSSNRHGKLDCESLTINNF
jgi:hypothetical protein